MVGRLSRQVLDATKQEMRFPQVEGEFFDEDGRRHKQDRWIAWLDITDKEQFTQRALIEGIKRKIKSLPVWDAKAEKDLSDLIEDYYQKQKEADGVVIFPCIPMKREFTGHVGLTEAYEYTGGIENFSYLLYDKPILIEDFLSALCQIIFIHWQFL